MFVAIVYKHWKTIVLAAMCLACLFLLLALACGPRRTQTNNSASGTSPTPSPTRDDHDSFHGVDVAPKQVLIQVSSCAGVESKKLTETVKKFSQEVTQDSQVTASRGAIGCWFLIKSSTLTAQQLVDLFKQAITARRPITVDQLSALVVHVEPNFLLHISPPINDQPFKKTTPTTLRRVGFQPEDPPVPSPPDDHLYQVNALWGLRNHDHPGVDIHAAEAWQQGT